MAKGAKTGFELGGVPETLLWNLYYRALEARRPAGDTVLEGGQWEGPLAYRRPARDRRGSPTVVARATPPEDARVLGARRALDGGGRYLAWLDGQAGRPDILAGRSLASSSCWASTMVRIVGTCNRVNTRAALISTMPGT
jgi:hypothetical protein